MRGAEPVPLKLDKIRQYTGQWKAGLMDGFGVVKLVLSWDVVCLGAEYKIMIQIWVAKMLSCI